VRLYPDEPAARNRTVGRDVLVVVLLVLFAWLGLRVHDDIASLGQLGAGVAQAGGSVKQGFGSAAGAVSGVPIVGGQLADGLRSAGASTGGNAVSLGHQGESDAHTAATIIGWLVFLLPTALVLQRFLPLRVAQVSRMSAAAQFLAGVEDPDRQRLLAERAAFSLPYGQLLRHSRDPLGDLQAGRYEPLIAAVIEDAGIRPPR
jgi:hypothetical protein